MGEHRIELRRDTAARRRYGTRALAEMLDTYDAERVGDA